MLLRLSCLFLPFLLVGCGGGGASSSSPYRTLRGEVTGDLAVSNGGSVIVSVGENEPMLWRGAGNAAALPALGGYKLFGAGGVSADGFVYGGVASKVGSPGAWLVLAARNNTVAVPLPDESSSSVPFSLAASADGSTLLVRVPLLSTSSLAHYILRDDGSLTRFGAPGDFPAGLSGDGRTVVGISEARPARWVDGGSATFILADETHGDARAANGDGSVIVGILGDFQSQTVPSYAFRWTAAGGAVSLGTLPGFFRSEAVAVSLDGKAVVGNALPKYAIAPEEPSEPFVWTAGTGLVSLRSLTVQGAKAWEGISSVRVTGLSPDGRTVVGIADRPGISSVDRFGWRIELPGSIR